MFVPTTSERSVKSRDNDGLARSLLVQFDRRREHVLEHCRANSEAGDLVDGESPEEQRRNQRGCSRRKLTGRQ